MRGRVVLGAAVLAAMLAPMAGAESADGWGTTNGLDLKGDLRAELPTGVVHAHDLGAGPLALSLTARELTVTNVTREYVVVLPGDSTNPLGAPIPGRSSATPSEFEGARLEVTSVDADDGPAVLLYDTMGAWRDPRAADLAVQHERVVGRVSMVEAEHVVVEPRESEGMTNVGGNDDLLTFRLPSQALVWTAAAAAEEAAASVRMEGDFSLYLWAANIRVTAENGAVDEWESGYHEPHGAPGGEVQHIEYRYLLVQAKDGVLEMQAPVDRLVWYAVGASITVLGQADATWDEAQMRLAGRPYLANETGRLEGEFTIQATSEGDQGMFRWAGDVRGTTFQPEPAAEAAAPARGGLGPFAAAASVVVGLGMGGLMVWVARGPRAPAPRAAAPGAPVAARAPQPVLIEAADMGETKESVLRLIERRPGLHASAVAKALGIHRNLAIHHVHDLMQRGVLFAVDSGGRTALFRTGRVRPEEANAYATLALETTAAVAAHLSANPGATIQGMAEALTMVPRSVARDLQRLREAGLARRDMLARPARFYPSELLVGFARRGHVPGAVLGAAALSQAA